MVIEVIDNVIGEVTAKTSNLRKKELKLGGNLQFGIKAIGSI